MIIIEAENETTEINSVETFDIDETKADEYLDKLKGFIDERVGKDGSASDLIKAHIQNKNADERFLLFKGFCIGRSLESASSAPTIKKAKKEVAEILALIKALQSVSKSKSDDCKDDKKDGEKQAGDDTGESTQSTERLQSL